MELPSSSSDFPESQLLKDYNLTKGVVDDPDACCFYGTWAIDFVTCSVKKRTRSNFFKSLLCLHLPAAPCSHVVDKIELHKLLVAQRGSFSAPLITQGANEDHRKIAV